MAEQYNRFPNIDNSHLFIQCGDFANIGINANLLQPAVNQSFDYGHGHLYGRGGAVPRRYAPVRRHVMGNSI